ncbi:MAG: DNA-directed RNA polymerase subunit P [Nanoarchaeota archaeon]|nr:DNA-directed RNA polymerase subunit P [Nanoarchaeota archaeon]
MVSYICANCSKDVQKELVTRKIRCPYCGSKVLKKKGTITLDPIKAR